MRVILTLVKGLKRGSQGPPGGALFIEVSGKRKKLLGRDTGELGQGDVSGMNGTGDLTQS